MVWLLIGDVIAVAGGAHFTSREGGVKAFFDLKPWTARSPVDIGCPVNALLSASGTRQPRVLRVHAAVRDWRRVPHNLFRLNQNIAPSRGAGEPALA
jgi:hypothetical protein